MTKKCFGSLPGGRVQSLVVQTMGQVCTRGRLGSELGLLLLRKGLGLI